MKVVTALLFVLQTINAHYCFPRLIVNNTISKAFQYVRDGTGSRFYPPFVASLPIRSPDSPDVVCGAGAPGGHEGIETARVIAGEQVGFMVAEKWTEFDDQPYIWHEGPGQIFLSALPSTDVSPSATSLDTYAGDGDWFKIGYSGPLNSTDWELYWHLGMNATIPLTTPPGKYLMRIEQFMPGPEFNQTEWYVACAQIEIVGPGGGKPEGFVRFPGAYPDPYSPSVWFHDENGGWPKDLTTYIEPEPAVWTG